MGEIKSIASLQPLSDKSPVRPAGCLEDAELIGNRILAGDVCHGLSHRDCYGHLGQGIRWDAFPACLLERPGNRGIGYVPQDGALFGTMTVRQHLAFALHLRKWEKAKIQERVQELAGQLKIESLLERRPQGLSGGEIQRVAIGRALSFYPKVLLLDEPLSSLDETTQEKLITLLQTLYQNTKLTVLHITHHRHEAERLGTVHLRFVDHSIMEQKSIEVR